MWGILGLLGCGALFLPLLIPAFQNVYNSDETLLFFVVSHPIWQRSFWAAIGSMVAGMPWFFVEYWFYIRSLNGLFGEVWLNEHLELVGRLPMLYHYALGGFSAFWCVKNLTKSPIFSLCIAVPLMMMGPLALSNVGELRIHACGLSYHMLSWAAFSSPASAVSLSLLRATKTSAWPCLANSRASSAPMPADAPVMRTRPNLRSPTSVGFLSVFGFLRAAIATADQPKRPCARKTLARRDRLGRRSSSLGGAAKRRDELLQDFRTATFIARWDGDTFRFAHTSLQEYFLAVHLVNALEEEQLDEWSLPEVNVETLDFAAELFVQRCTESAAACTRLEHSLRALLSESVPQRSQNALRFYIRLHANGESRFNLSMGFTAPASFDLPPDQLSKQMITGMS